MEDDFSLASGNVSPDSGNGPALQVTLIWAEGESSVEIAFFCTKNHESYLKTLSSSLDL